MSEHIAEVVAERDQLKRTVIAAWTATGCDFLSPASNLEDVIRDMRRDRDEHLLERDRLRAEVGMGHSLRATRDFLLELVTAVRKHRAKPDDPGLAATVDHLLAYTICNPKPKPEHERLSTKLDRAPRGEGRSFKGGMGSSRGSRR